MAENIFLRSYRFPRATRFVATLQQAAAFDASDTAAFIRLQNSITEAHYAESDWRAVQNFVGVTQCGYFA